MAILFPKLGNFCDREECAPRHSLINAKSPERVDIQFVPRVAIGSSLLWEYQLIPGKIYSLKNVC